MRRFDLMLGEYHLKEGKKVSIRSPYDATEVGEVVFGGPQEIDHDSA